MKEFLKKRWEKFFKENKVSNNTITILIAVTAGFVLSYLAKDMKTLSIGFFNNSFLDFLAAAILISAFYLFVVMFAIKLLYWVYMRVMFVVILISEFIESLIKSLLKKISRKLGIKWNELSAIIIIVIIVVLILNSIFS